MHRRNFLTALSLGSGTWCPLPAIAQTAGVDRHSWQPDGLRFHQI
jgi:hypothetical protein